MESLWIAFTLALGIASGQLPAAQDQNGGDPRLTQAAQEQPATDVAAAERRAVPAAEAKAKRKAAQ